MKEQNKPEIAITKISDVDACHVEAMLRYPLPFTPERIAFINGAKFQSTHMYTAEDCTKMLEALRQRCAEEVKPMPDHLEAGMTSAVIDKQSILSIDLNQFLKL